jgi:NAD(P)-dependent dehydrogenase (short-subunit alcohol dehydrogenase family)
MKIDGSTFLVTGGASGLGRATVERLLAHGGRVGILDLERSAGAQIAGELGPHALFTPCDVTSADNVGAAMDAAAARFGPIRGLVNCAGVAIAEKTTSAPSPSSSRSI